MKVFDIGQREDLIKTGKVYHGTDEHLLPVWIQSPSDTHQKSV